MGHRRLKNQRNDLAQTQSSMRVNSHNFIASEDLDIKNMVKNHRLAKSIEDADWQELAKNIVYRAGSAGQSYVIVNPRNTSKICSAYVSI